MVFWNRTANAVTKPIAGEVPAGSEQPLIATSRQTLSFTNYAPAAAALPVDAEAADENRMWLDKLIDDSVAVEEQSPVWQANLRVHGQLLPTASSRVDAAETVISPHFAAHADQAVIVATEPDGQAAADSKTPSAIASSAPADGLNLRRDGAHPAVTGLIDRVLAAVQKVPQ